MLELGIALLHSGAMFRNVAELDEAVAVLKAADRKAERLSNLVSVLVTLFEWDGGPAMLDEAIRTGREAVATANPRHAQHAPCLFGLASGLFRRGELHGTLLDFDEAAVLSGQVVEATPPGHTYRAMHLIPGTRRRCAIRLPPRSWRRQPPTLRGPQACSVMTIRTGQ